MEMRSDSDEIISYKAYFQTGGTPHMKGVGMLVGNFELNP